MNYFLNKDCFFDILVWCKTNAMPAINGTFLSDIEYCLMFRKKGKTKLYSTSDVNDKHKWYCSGINVKDKKAYLHPTIKPLDFVKSHIKISSKKGDLVLDCFCGSGTTCVACQETGRNFIGIEINQKYYEIANNRLKGETANGQMGFIIDEEGNVLNGF